MPTRVDKALRHLALVVADEPEVGAACTTALLGGGDRSRGARRPRPDRRGDPPPHRVGHRAGRASPAPCPRSRWPSSARWCKRAAASSPITRSPTGWPTWCGSSWPESTDRTAKTPKKAGRMTVHLGDPELVLDPYDYDFHEDPYPYYKRLRDEAPLYRNEELGFWALSRHGDVQQGFRNSTTLSNRDGVVAGPGIARTARVEDDVVPGDGRPRPPAAAHAGVEGLHPAPDPRTRAAGHRTRRPAPRRHAGEGRIRSSKQSTMSRNSPASCRWT